MIDELRRLAGIKTEAEDKTAVLNRLKSSEVGYMELKAKGTGFSCGNCRSIARGVECLNPAVKAPVSATHGCCNLFFPAKADDTRSSAEWAASEELWP